RGGSAETDVPERLPGRRVDVVAKLDRDSAEDQQPEDDHQRQVESAEARRVQSGEGEVERSAGGEQPDFVAVPDGSDGFEDADALVVGMGGSEMDDSGAEIESIEHGVAGDHYGDEAEPERFHLVRLLRSVRDFAVDEQEKQDREHRVDAHEA